MDLVFLVALVKGDAKVLSPFPFHFNFIVAFEYLDKVVDVFSSDVFDSEVVHH